jgi:hypothetical protein
MCSGKGKIMVNCSLCRKGMLLPWGLLTIIDEENARSHVLKLCRGCSKKPILEALERAKKQRDCCSCGYFDFKYEGGKVIAEGRLRGGFLGGFCRKLDLKLPAFRMNPLNSPSLGPNRVFFRSAEKCTHYEDKRDLLKKVMRGEIATEKEAYYVVCKYCGGRYDMNKSAKCPSCGATNP